jgi:hypothetical protein
LFALCSASVSALQIVFSDSSYESNAKCESGQIFQKGHIVGARFGWSICNQTATSLGVSRAGCDDIHRSWEEVIS